MLSENDWSRLTRYVAGETSPFEGSHTERWIQENPERQLAYAELREIWSARSAAVDVDEAWSRFVERSRSESTPLHATDSNRRRSVRPSRHGWRRMQLTRAAAIGLLLVVGGILARRFGVRPSDRWDTGQSYVTSTGELAPVSLPDGTEVVVGVRSQLLVASDFGADTRDVQIQGEAFFRVAPDPNRPFTVYTAEARTRVLGTSFSVSSRGAGTETVVQEGTVRITPLTVGGEAAELSAGHLGRVLPEGRHVEVSHVNVDDRLAWLQRRLVFRNTPFRDILERLELWYDVELRVEDVELSGRRLNASLEHPPLAELLTAIALAGHASYDLDEGTVTFVPRQ